jgi:hypothetical protein
MRTPADPRLASLGFPLLRRLALLAAGAGMLAACPGQEQMAEVEPIQLFQADLQPVGASGVSGTASLELWEQELRAAVSARGLEAGTSVPQHVLSSDDCNAFGRSVLNLDARITAPGEGDLWGETYPYASGDGSLDYEASRPIKALVSALHEYRGMTLNQLNLGSRTVVLQDESRRPVACGELESVEWSGAGAR